MIKYLRKKALILPVLLLLAGLFIAKTVITAENFRINKELLEQVEIKCGKVALTRVTNWEDLIRQDRSRTDREKLEKVNNFFNSNIRFASDWEVWAVEDYWATPMEFLCKSVGDCEDFAIAKFFTLKALGVPEEKLNLSYVKAIQYNVHHMVLTYYSEPGAEPLVLDNLIDAIKPGSQRTDLMPIFSFNGTGLWTAKQRGKGVMAGSSSRIKPWQDVLQKISSNKL